MRVKARVQQITNYYNEMYFPLALPGVPISLVLSFSSRRIAAFTAPLIVKSRLVSLTFYLPSIYLKGALYSNPTRKTKNFQRFFRWFNSIKFRALSCQDICGGPQTGPENRGLLRGNGDRHFILAPPPRVNVGGKMDVRLTTYCYYLNVEGERYCLRKRRLCGI